MKVSIAIRYAPFSHVAGASCLLPRTGLTVQAFPSLIRVGSIEVALPLSGPVQEFTLQQDLEKGCVFVWGKASEGRFRIRINAAADGIHWTCEKGLAGMAKALWWNLPGSFLNGSPKERFSLGSHLAQDMDLAWRRLTLEEMLPLLYRLSQWTPSYPAPALKMCDLTFEKLLLGAFRSILVPSWTDELHQGLLPTEAALPDMPAAALVHFLGKKIRSLFLVEAPMSLTLHKPMFAFGRFTDLDLPGIGTLDLEWSKGMIRKAILRATHSGELCFKTPYRCFRWRTSLREKGRLLSTEQLQIEENSIYYLDRFQK